MGQRIGRIFSRLPCFSADHFHDEETKRITETKESKESKEGKVSPPSPIHDTNETVYVAHAYHFPIRIMGSTGSGKTTFINVASGSDLRVGMGLESCTDEVQTSVPFSVSGRQVVLLDTPGFDDTNLTDTDVLRIISAYLVAMNKRGARLVGVIYMQRISDLKVQGSARRDLRMFQELCGEEAYENVVVVTNMWGVVPEEDALAREEELANKDIFYKPILDKGGRMMRHHNTQRSAHLIIEQLIHREPVVLRIQRELAEGIDITQTGAFKQLDRELSELAAQHQKDLEKLKAEMAEAEQARDEETRQELAEERQKVEEELRKVQTQASRLASDYQTELRKIEEKLHVKEDGEAIRMTSCDKEIRIAVMGATGSGKTTFINRASGSNFPVEKGLQSCTTEVVTSKPFLLNGQVVTLIDTPGFDDTTRSDTDVLTSIAAYLSNTYEQGAKLSGIIYMHRISDVRMSGTSKRNFRIFRELCGESTLRSVLIVTNMWGHVDPKVGEERENELTTNERLFKSVLDKGARLHRHDNTEASAHSILRYLIHGPEATLAIQHEIVNEHKDLPQTAAGAELTRILREQAERHGEELCKLRGEMEDAMRVKDEARRQLQEEVERKREEIERIQRDLERMATDFLAEKARLESRIAEMEAKNRRYLETLEELQDQVNNARMQVESMQMEHARRESELLAAQQDESECKARLLEEVRLARERAELQHWEEISRMEAEKIQKDEEYADKIMTEREKVSDLSVELERQAMIREEEEQSRKFAEDIIFLVNFATKTFLPKSLETRTKALMVQAARAARESTTTGHKLISTYFSR
ncbi:hypothetical protein ID866_5282 [Astraeus odoratus]|nr:hypothetical protein ID866_5282 [Astraeus odoratus]